MSQVLGESNVQSDFVANGKCVKELYYASHT